jgi:large subunit ribosomal protein L23
MEKNPYNIIKCRYITEKATVLANLANSESNACVKKCKTPKVVFIVDKKANKQEIAWAIEKIYAKKGVKVKKVNTVNVHPKWKRVRGHVGQTEAFKKAIITLHAGSNIDETSAK